MPKVLEQTNSFFLIQQDADEDKHTKRQVTHRKNEAGTANDPELMLDDVNENYNKGFAARKALL